MHRKYWQVLNDPQLTGSAALGSAISQPKIVSILLALGVRYAELEGIRRELQDALAVVRSKIADILTAAQKAKVKNLDDARNLQPLIADALCENMLVPPFVSTLSDTTCGVGSFSFVTP